MLPPPERRAFGQSRRKQVRRQEQKRWSAADRQTDPIDALAVSAVGRVPALLAIKWQRMAASPFGFFRGAVPVMAADLAVLPHTGIFTQLCGDAHVRNLGAYAAPDGRLVFDINDFDETIRGPFEWDVKRLATSIILAGRESGSKSAACGEAAAILLQELSPIHARLRAHDGDGGSPLSGTSAATDCAGFAGSAQGRAGNAAVQRRRAYLTAEGILQGEKVRHRLTASSSNTSLCNSGCRAPRRR